MTCFGLEVTDEKAHAKIQAIRTNLLVDNLARNPFEAKITIHGKDFYVVQITPIWPAVPIFAPFPGLIWFMFPGYWFGTVAAIIFFLMLFLALWWWNRFYFFLFWVVTKRGVKYVSPTEVIRRVV